MRGMPGFGRRHENMLRRAKITEPCATLRLGMVVACDARIAVGIEMLAAQVARRLGMGSKRQVRFAAGKFGLEIARIERQRLKLQPGPSRSQPQPAASSGPARTGSCRRR